MALDSQREHQVTFAPAMSLFVECRSEEEVDRLYAVLTEGGDTPRPLADYGFSRKFGWVQDRYGVSWQQNHAKS